MHMTSANYTLRLFKNRQSFLGGVASLIDMSPNANKYNNDKTEKEADTKSLQADWSAVGEDMKNAIGEYATAESTQSA